MTDAPPTSELPEKLNTLTPDGVARNIDKLAELFPGCLTETRDPETGEVQRGINLDALRQEISDHVVEGSEERYRLDWPGKRAATLAANAPIDKTLRPVREESVNFDSTQNLFIEGDNLDALKLLQETYLGKVKMIFIDPPYNTGKEFIYDDDFAEDADTYLKRSGQRAEDGAGLVANPESNGRYHSDWLSMMWPRLKLARNLLRDDGVIFIAIDDHEVANLRRVCDEVFGEKNFVATLIWQSRTSISNDQPISLNHNSILCFSRQIDDLKFAGEPMNEDEYRNSDGDPRGPWKPVPLDANKPGGATMYEIVNENNGVSYVPPNGRSWAVNQAEYERLLADGRIAFGRSGDSTPKRKLFLNERREKGDTKTPSSILASEVGTTKSGTEETMVLFNDEKIFSYPKPKALISKLMQYADVARGDIVVDFFAGSGTTAASVLQTGARFIVVQIPEPLIEGTEQFKNASAAGCRDLACLAKKRLYAELRLDEEKNIKDPGFRVLKIDLSNFKDTRYLPNDISQASLLDTVDHVKEDRTGEDLLFQILLSWGVDLGLPIALENLSNHRTFFVDTDALAACFETNLDETYVKALAARKPLRAVFRDGAFGGDAGQINVVQLFRQLSPDTDVKVL